MQAKCCIAFFLFLLISRSGLLHAALEPEPDTDPAVPNPVPGSFNRAVEQEPDPVVSNPAPPIVNGTRKSSAALIQKKRHSVAVILRLLETFLTTCETISTSSITFSSSTTTSSTSIKVYATYYTQMVSDVKIRVVEIVEIVSSMDTSTSVRSSTAAPSSIISQKSTLHEIGSSIDGSISMTTNADESSSKSSPTLSTSTMEMVSSMDTSTSTMSSTAAPSGISSKKSTLGEIGSSIDGSISMTTNADESSSNSGLTTSSSSNVEIVSSMGTSTSMRSSTAAPSGIISKKSTLGEIGSSIDGSVSINTNADKNSSNSSSTTADTSIMEMVSSMNTSTSSTSTSATPSSISSTRSTLGEIGTSNYVSTSMTTNADKRSSNGIPDSSPTIPLEIMSSMNTSTTTITPSSDEPTPSGSVSSDTAFIPSMSSPTTGSTDTTNTNSIMAASNTDVVQPKETTRVTSASTLFKGSSIKTTTQTVASVQNSPISIPATETEQTTPQQTTGVSDTTNIPQQGISTTSSNGKEIVSAMDTTHLSVSSATSNTSPSSSPTLETPTQSANIKTEFIMGYSSQEPTKKQTIKPYTSSETPQMTMQTAMMKDETTKISEANIISPTMGKIASPDGNQSALTSTDDITSQPPKHEHSAIKPTSPVTTQLTSGVKYVSPQMPNGKIITSMKEDVETLETLETELSTTGIRTTPESTSAKLNFYGISSKSLDARPTTALDAGQQEVTNSYVFTPKTTKDVAQETVTSRLPSVSMEGSTPDINLSTKSEIDNMASKTTASVPTNALEYMTPKTHDVSVLTENVTDGKPIPEMKNTTESTSIGQNLDGLSWNSTYAELTSLKDKTETDPSSYTAYSVPGNTKHTTRFPKLFEKIISDNTLKLATTTVQERQTYGIDNINETETSHSAIGLQENESESILKTTERLTNSPLNSTSPILPAKPSLQTASAVSSVLTVKTTPQATPKASSISSSLMINLSPQALSNMSTIPSDKTSSLETSNLSSIPYKTKLAYQATSAHESHVTTKASMALTFLDVTQTHRRDETIAKTHDMNTTQGDKFGSAVASTTRLQSRSSTIFNTASADQLSSTARKFMDLLKTSSDPMKTLQRSTTEATNGQRTAHGDETPRATSSDEHTEFNQNGINPSVEPSTINLDGRTTEEQLIRETTSRPGFESLERFTRPRTRKYEWQERFDDMLEEVPPPRRIEDMHGPGGWFGGGGAGITDSNVSTTITPDQIQQLLKPIVRPTPRPKEDSKDFVPETMSEIVQFVSDIEHYMGCAFIIVTLALMIIAFLIVFRTRNPEGILMSELFISLLIAHLVTMLMREPRLLSGWPKVTCLIAGMIYQYAYLSVYILLVLLSLQVLLIYGKFSPGGWVLGPYISFFLAYSVPMFVVLITFFSMPTSYTTDWTCIGNMNTHLASVLFIPAIVLFSTAFIVSESGSIFNRDLNHLLEYDAESMTRNGFVKSFLVIGGPMITFNHACTSVAVYTQQITWFTIVFALNISTTIAIVMLCVPIEDKVRQFAVRVWNFMRERCCCRPRVAPEEPPVEEIN